MTEESKYIIRAILDELGIQFDEITRKGPTGNRFRITGNFGLPKDVFFNIPHNQGFVFQLLFEGAERLQERDTFFNRINNNPDYSYWINEGQYGMNYLTIYLSQNLEITLNNSEQIAMIISDRIKGIQRILMK